MLAYLFVIFAVAARLPFMPHPWNFTPVMAALLYFASLWTARKMSVSEVAMAPAGTSSS